MRMEWLMDPPITTRTEMGYRVRRAILEKVLSISKKNIRKQEADLCKYDYITLFSVRQCSLKGTSGLAEEQE